MTRAFIFDLDGTLADTLESLVFSVKATLREMGLDEITDEQCRHFVGNGARYLMDHAIRAAGDPEGERLEEAMEEGYEKAVRAAEMILAGEVDGAMNEYNRKVKPGEN